MKVWHIASGKGINALKLTERAIPTPGDREVLVRVNAVSLNYRDLIIAKMQYGNVPGGAQIVPASDGAGEVVETGPGVARLKKGDRVAGTFFQKWIQGKPTAAGLGSALGGDLDGMLTEYICLHEDGVVKVPEHLSCLEGACLPCAGVTAWNALVTRGHLKQSESVLTMGTGGVSLFTLVFAKILGARVIVISGSDQKIKRATELGAWKTVNYNTQTDWDKAVLGITGEAGVDHVVELGGPKTLPKSLNCVAVGGHVAQIGVLAGFQGMVSPFVITLKSVDLSGIYVGSRENFEAMNKFLSSHQIHPIIDRVFTFGDTPDAYRYLESGAHFGKVVVNVAG